MAGPKLMLTEFGIHHRLESCKAVLGGLGGGPKNSNLVNPNAAGITLNFG